MAMRHDNPRPHHKCWWCGAQHLHINGLTLRVLHSWSDKLILSSLSISFAYLSIAREQLYEAAKPSSRPMDGCLAHKATPHYKCLSNVLGLIGFLGTHHTARHRTRSAFALRSLLIITGMARHWISIVILRTTVYFSGIVLVFATYNCNV